MWPLSKFSFIDVLKFYFVDLPCLYRFFAAYFLLAYLNAHYLIFLSMVHKLNMHISYKYITKLVYYNT